MHLTTHVASLAGENKMHGILAMTPAAFMAGSYRQAAPDPEAAYTLFKGVALIPVFGTLQHYSGDVGTGYDWIKANFLNALHDPKVKAIAFVIDSDGGEVAGCFDLVDLIYASRAIKPLMAVCSESAYSAAYALASACEVVTVPRTGYVGSVGVLAAHTDHSGELEQAKVKVTLVHHGQRKADGAPTEPLSPRAAASMQADVNMTGDLFVNTVARNRRMSPSAVRATQAAAYLGHAGVTIGFADHVLSPDDALCSFIELLENQT